MGQRDIAYSNIPRVCFFWSNRKRTAGESLGNPNPQKPKHKSMPVRNAQTKQPSTSRLSHYQHFMLMWRDQQHARKTTWVLSIMVETYELLRPLGDENSLLTHTYTHTPAHTHTQSCLLAHIMSNRAIGARELQIHLIWEIRTEQQDNQQHPDTQLLFHCSTLSTISLTQKESNLNM